jgi:hypothetical protein
MLRNDTERNWKGKCILSFKNDAQIDTIENYRQYSACLLVYGILHDCRGLIAQAVMSTIETLWLRLASNFSPFVLIAVGTFVVNASAFCSTTKTDRLIMNRLTH